MCNKRFLFGERIRWWVFEEKREKGMWIWRLGEGKGVERVESGE